MSRKIETEVVMLWSRPPQQRVSDASLSLTVGSANRWARNDHVPVSTAKSSGQLNPTYAPHSASSRWTHEAVISPCLGTPLAAKHTSCHRRRDYQQMNSTANASRGNTYLLLLSQVCDESWEPKKVLPSPCILVML